MKECEYVVKNNMKRNKSPGLDRIPIEFYIQFWNTLRHIMLEIYNESYDNGEMPDSQKLWVLTLIYKNGNRVQLNKYRAISLTNCDYRILANVMANRLYRILPYIISEDQAGYVKGRFIGHNIRGVKDIIHYSKTKHLDNIVAMLDFEKAFDSIQWSFIYYTLNKLNINIKYINWIKLL